MAVYQFSALSDGQSLVFNPNTDVLNFDATNNAAPIAAADLRITAVGANTRVEVVGGFFAGKDVTLQNVSPLQLTTTNVTFFDGSRLLFGDNSTAQNDDLAQSLTGTAGRDLLQGFGGADTMNGGAGNDTYIVGAGDVVSDSGGIDTVITDVTFSLGADFENVQMIGTGNIGATGNNNNNLAIGNAGDNYFNMRAGSDTIQAGAGNDWIDMSAFGTGSYGNDFIDGGAGIDTVNFAIGAGQQSAITADLTAGTISGGGAGGAGTASVTSVERVIGAAFNDVLKGSGASETLEGREGNDTLSGMAGNDTLIGGTGQDIFVFGATPGAANADLVADFVSGTDKLTFDTAVFTGLGAAGNFAAGDARFAAGAGFTSGRDASDRIIYNTTTGQLFYDADGSGTGAAQLVATLQGAPALAATDVTTSGGTPVQGTAGDDALTGTEGADSISGLAGSDTINGLGGNDTLDGGAGIDFLTGGVGDDSLVGGDEFDQLDGMDGNDTLIGGGGDDELRGWEGNDQISGGDGNDWLIASGSDRLDGGAGNDLVWNFDVDSVLDAGSGVDTVDVMGGPVIVNLAAGTLTRVVDMQTTTFLNVENVFRTDFGAGVFDDHDVISDDYIIGSDADNDLSGGNGDNTLNGGLGNDTFIGANVVTFGVAPGTANADTVSGALSSIQLDAAAFANAGPLGNFVEGDARFFAGAGATSGQDASDRVVYNTSTGQLFYDADGNGAGASQLIATLQPGFGAMFGATNLAIIDSRLTGPIEGTAGNEWMAGADGFVDDTFHGRGGNDRFDGRQGNDTVDGGDGDDTLAGGDGIDLLLGGSGNDVLRERTELSGTRGVGAGADTLDGGLGNDTYELDAFELVGSPILNGTIFNVVLRDAGGVDTVVVSNTSWTLAEGFENLALRPGDVQFGVGNASNNVIRGEGGGVTIDGAGGDDTLIDTAGGSTLIGGEGRDTFVFAVEPFRFGSPSHPDLVMDFVSGSDTLAFDSRVFTNLGGAGSFGGADARFFAAAGANAGHDADDRIVYNTSTGQLFYDADGSGAGASRLVATLQGAPTLVATDIAVDNGTAPGGQTITGTAGNDSLTGTEGNDSITGLGGADTLNGLGGNDTLDGGADIDALNGGLGNDTYVVTSGDVLTDTGGVDTVVTDVNWTLGADFENLTMTGTGGISVTGTNGANLASGNSGSNYFNLRAGNDTIQAGAGNDWVDMSAFGTASYGDDSIDGGAGTDTVNFAIGAGQQSAITVDLTAGTIRGGGAGGVGSASVTSVERVIGAGFSDSLKGSTGAETLEGREGNDTLSGMGGNDTLVGGMGSDSFVFAAAPGAGNVDLVSDFVSGTDKVAFDNAVFTALGVDGNFAASDARFAAGAGFTSGRDASDRIVYDTSTGSLYYDADGNGAGAAQLVATLQGNPAITATDITVI